MSIIQVNSTGITNKFISNWQPSLMCSLLLRIPVCMLSLDQNLHKQNYVDFNPSEKTPLVSFNYSVVHKNVSLRLELSLVCLSNLHKCSSKLKQMFLRLLFMYKFKEMFYPVQCKRVRSAQKFSCRSHTRRHQKLLVIQSLGK